MPNLTAKELGALEDQLSAEQLLIKKYKTYANECATTAIRDEMMNILHDEHDIQADIFMEMQKRGWYPTPMAEEQKIQSTKQKFLNMTAQN